jgi:hypothetical protein
VVAAVSEVVLVLFGSRVFCFLCDLVHGWFLFCEGLVVVLFPTSNLVLFWFTLLHGDGDSSEMVVMRSVVVAADLKWGGGGGDIYELGVLVAVTMDLSWACRWQWGFVAPATVLGVLFCFGGGFSASVQVVGVGRQFECFPSS